MSPTEERRKAIKQLASLLTPETLAIIAAELTADDYELSIIVDAGHANAGDSFSDLLEAARAARA